MAEKQRPLALQSARTRRRLPTLAEVLARRTAAPVDLFSLYIFMQREDAENALDLWLDCQQHENLCRAYFKDLRRSGRTVREDWPSYYAEARERGSIYNRVNGIDEETEPWDREKWEAERPQSQHIDAPAPHAATGESADPSALAETGDTAGPRFPGDPDFVNSSRAERRTMLAKRASVAPTVISRNAAITRTDLIASAERIYARYLLPGSEKEVYLPPQLRIASFPISSQTLPHPADEEQQRALARVPDMFHAQKEYVFRTMESDLFPRFLRAKAFGNLTPISALVRLSLGLLALWAAFATAFSFIFLDVNRTKRLWVILPFAVAIFLIVSHQYELDPVLAFASQSETTPFHLITIKEVYVRQLLMKRAVGILFLIGLITAALTILFVFVPGHRL
ncbi:Bud site selection protein, Revert to axial protein 1 [Tilletia horrida]|uniref:Bud site selection protein, Revert to axial protein 1 n=1 Tax=Tilletia horrida TaxID=155126 RepID=A0AAN6GAC9_9BASI|nr:Bud site selection protein, Revert to axial protein 1 [Tilletia horrida]KAK0531223.1 Bud site selection protein, Revert to axial protein 1 [Tilletia horrida]KAK0532044.1 Bud site selection protein, Revert to axial protein 1 [Tilletia horrida]KAK0560606.1 Bud site selection protein, Revert to axial protein 1 [Tilletia horrida]